MYINQKVHDQKQKIAIRSFFLLFNCADICLFVLSFFIVGNSKYELRFLEKGIANEIR